MFRRKVQALALVAAALLGCTPRNIMPQTNPPQMKQRPAALTPRPQGSPDVLLLSVSGRCTGRCHAPGDNVDYLTPRGTVGAVAAVLEAQGLSVQAVGVADHLTLHTPVSVNPAQIGAGNRVDPVQNGFLQLETQLVQADREWIRGRANPTRIVLLGHSHGVVWTHALARAHPDIPIAAMIDLDGVCDFWELDHRRLVAAYVRQLGHTPWPFDLSDACGAVRVGHVRYDLKDVVYEGVARDLEVQSRRLLSRPDGSVRVNLPFDALSNVRIDGSRGGLSVYRSNETHGGVSLPGSRAVAWVREQLQGLSGGWKGEGAPAQATAPR